MKQYERIVSYIYQYKQGEKGANVGYAKVEQRGGECRVQVQMRGVASRKQPLLYFFKQYSEGIRTIPVQELEIHGNNLSCKVWTKADALFDTEYTLEEMDGIFIFVHEELYYATSWGKDTFFLGDWLVMQRTEENKKRNLETEEKMTAAEQIEEKTEEKSYKEETDITWEGEEKRGEKRSVERNEAVAPVENDGDAEEASTEEMQEDIQMQSICGVCPFKHRTHDYGKRILHSYPSMKPFSDIKDGGCVRMELQDIGCLPIKYWALSGNRFLLHGYSCYRHLIFLQLAEGKYALGIPGIYSEKECRNAENFGMREFKSIGDFGKIQGAFGYWLYELQ